MSRGIVVFLIFFLPLLFDSRIDLPFVITALLSIYGRRVVWSIIMKRFDLNGNQYWPSNVITAIWNYNFINKTIVSRLLSGHYRLPGFLRIADVSSSRRAVGIVIYFARFDMYRNVRKGTW